MSVVSSYKTKFNFLKLGGEGIRVRAGGGGVVFGFSHPMLFFSAAFKNCSCARLGSVTSIHIITCGVTETLRLLDHCHGRDAQREQASLLVTRP